MSPAFFQQLRAQSATLHVRWETLLRMEPVSGPLANPDALVRLIPESLARVFRELTEAPEPGCTLTELTRTRLPSCDCGYNPFLAYYIAGERAFTEAVVLLQTPGPAARNESELASVIDAVRRLAHDEIDTFCGICTHRGLVANCPVSAGAAPAVG